MKVLEVENVYKKIRKKDIIKGINFSIESGEIFGFLGPNGAGKTTTIRMLVGLIAPSYGSIKIMGHDIQKEKVEALKNVGCIVENPDMYNDLTGMQNLKFYGDLYGNISLKRIDEIVEIIGLKDRINDKVKNYSLGMKQRLGLGQAIMSKPKLLILDEPTNGLDPIGILEFRDIIKNIAKEYNTTVFISSHILSEIEQICDSFAIINEGVIQAIEKVSKEEDTVIEKLEIHTNELKKMEEIFFKLSYVNNVVVDNERVFIEIKYGNFSKVIKEIGKSDIEVDDIHKIHDNLENKFMKILKGGI